LLMFAIAQPRCAIASVGGNRRWRPAAIGWSEGSIRLNIVCLARMR
jgi:hypothetical protein